MCVVPTSDRSEGSILGQRCEVRAGVSLSELCQAVHVLGAKVGLLLRQQFGEQYNARPLVGQ